MKTKLDYKNPAVLYGLCMMPFRILAFFIFFGPLKVLFLTGAKLGEWLNEACEQLDYNFDKIIQEFLFLTNGIQIEQAKDAIRELRQMKERERLLKELDGFSDNE